MPYALVLLVNTSRVIRTNQVASNHPDLPSHESHFPDRQLNSYSDLRPSTSTQHESTTPSSIPPRVRTRIQIWRKVEPGERLQVQRMGLLRPDTPMSMSALARSHQVRHLAQESHLAGVPARFSVDLHGFDWY